MNCFGFAFVFTFLLEVFFLNGDATSPLMLSGPRYLNFLMKIFLECEISRIKPGRHHCRFGRG